MPVNLATLSDEGLASHAQSGSLPAFEELVFRHEHPIFRYIASRTSRSEDAKDLTQEAAISSPMESEWDRLMGDVQAAGSFLSYLILDHSPTPG